jgi:hypothetical protein
MLPVGKITLADVCVFAICELIALPLCGASWHAIVVEGDIMRRGIGLSFGILTGLVGFTFYWWRENAKKYLIKTGKDWWPLAFVAVTLYLIDPRLFDPIRRIMPWVGPIIWSVGDVNTAGYFIGMSQQAGQDIRVFGFQANGRNISGSAISNIKGYIKSITTNRELPIYLLIMEKQNFPIPIPVPIAPNDTYGIPPFADFSVTTTSIPFPDTQKDAMSVAQFLSDFAGFDFVFEYDGYVYKHRFNANDIRKHLMHSTIFCLRISPPDAKKNDSNQIDEEVLKAEAEYRAAVNKSQLHSYTAMVRGKAVAEVTDSEVKSFEKYLIIIPSIAAALASTLIAITAVRRLKPPERAPITSIPDEAAAYLFGPLVQALRKEANDAVAAALNGRAKAPNTS